MLRATALIYSETKMEFNLAKAIIMPYARRGKLFPASPALSAMVNERIDRLTRELARQTAARESRAQAPAASGSAEPSARVA